MVSIGNILKNQYDREGQGERMIIFFEFPIILILFVIMAILGIDIIPIIIFICTITGTLGLLWGLIKCFFLGESASGSVMFSCINLFIAYLLDTSGVKFNLWSIFCQLF